MMNSFFKYAKERHAIYLRRLAGEDCPWTKDPILQNYRFTNVYRELDKTTVWFRKNVRDKYRDKTEVLLATVIFRWFNRIETGEAIFCQTLLSNGNLTAFEHFLKYRDVNVILAAIKAYCGDGPYVTGAYMIKSPTGMPKLEGMCELIKRFDQGKTRFNGEVANWETVAFYLHKSDYPLSSVWEWLKEFDHQGKFLAYEVVTDLRHTGLLFNAPDIMTWANPGPGAMRGVSRMLEMGFRKTPSGKTRPKTPTHGEVESVMLDILDASRVKWPMDWPPWEMREVEHTLCEWDKYERTRLGQGTPRGRYP